MECLRGCANSDDPDIGSHRHRGPGDKRLRDYSGLYTLAFLQADRILAMLVLLWADRIRKILISRVSDLPGSFLDVEDAIDSDAAVSPGGNGPAYRL